MLKTRSGAIVGTAFALAATPAFANYSALTAAVDFAAVKTALIAVAAVIVGVLIVRKGIRFVLGSIR